MSLFRSRPTASPKGRDRRSLREAGRRLRLEALEDRFLPSASLVKDIDPRVTGSTPQDLTVVGDQVYLYADDGVHGHELWKTDGTAAGTVLVKDIRPGPDSSLRDMPGSGPPFSMTPINGTVFFAADDGVHGRELWKSDGTPAGTVLVKDVYPGDPGLSSLGPTPSMVNVNGTLLFFATNAGGQAGLWKSDGTEAGTVFVKAFDYFPAPPTSGFEQLLVVGSTFYFAARDPATGAGIELWKTDGTPAGTVLVSNINPGSADSQPGNLTNLGGTVYFTAEHSSYGKELWKTDGTGPGTTLVKDIYQGAASGLGFHRLTVLGNTLYFNANDGISGQELWQSDGTDPGTRLFMDLVPGPAGSQPWNLVAANGLVYFSSLGTAPQRQWRTDGTPAGTIVLSSCCSFWHITPMNGVVYFRAGALDDLELWRSDGTVAGTRRVVDIYPGPNGSNPSHLVNFNGTLLFSASGRVHGRQLWRSDGTAAGTTQVTAINFTAFNSNPTDLVTLNGTLYFLARDGIHAGTSLYRSDGTAAGTQYVLSRAPLLFGLTSANGALYFSEGTSNTRRLNRSDGTAAGTSVLFTITGGQLAGVGGVRAADNRIYFTASRVPGGPFTFVMTSDGTVAGTRAVWSGSGQVTALAVVGNTLFFVPPGADRELWKSDDGAPAVRVKDINPGAASSNPSSLANVGGVLWFSATDGVYGRELWISDGTEEGTYLWADINPGPASSDPQNILAGFTYYPLFTADDGQSGREPWVCCFDGVTPTMIADINPGPAGSNPQGLLTDAAGFLYMSADDGARGRELWFSDWTPAGTRLVKDIHPGPLGSDPQKLTLLYGYYLYFSADDGVSGRELWGSDGSEEFTVLDTDINPGPGSSNPDFLVELPDGYVYFAATGPAEVGRELYRASPFFAGPGGAPGGAPSGGALADLLAEAAPAVVSPSAAAAAPRREVRPEADPPRRAAEAALVRALSPRKDRLDPLFARELGVLDLLPE